MALLVGANRQRSFLKIRNASSTAKVYIGQTSSVRSTTGHVIRPGSDISIEGYVGPVYYSPDDFDAISYSEFNANEMGTSVGWYDSTAYFIIDAISNRAMVRLTSGVVNGTPEELISGGYLTYARADTASHCESAPGVWSSVATGTLRRKYDGSIYIEPGVTNALPNPRAVNGAAGSPGSLPTSWQSNTSINGLSRTIVGVGTDDGIDYVDFRFSGTSTATTPFTVAGFALNTSVAAAVSEVWSSSFFCELVGGTLNNVVFKHEVSERNAGGSALATTFSDTVTPTTTTLGQQRITKYGFTLGNASTAFIYNRLNCVPAVAAIDFTLRIGWPQLEKLSVTTTPIMPDVGQTGASTRAVDAFALPTTHLSIATDGTLVAEFTSAYSLDAAGAVITNVIGFDTAGADQLAIHARHTAGKGPRLSIAATGVSPAAGPSANAIARAAARYKSSAADAALSVNGATAVTSATAASLSTPTSIGLGQAENGGGSQMTGVIRYLAGLSKVMSDGELAVESARYT